MTPETVVRVTDRSWEDLQHGCEFIRWPGALPTVGLRATVFDRDHEFSQHVVVSVKGGVVRLGPAIQW